MNVGLIIPAAGRGDRLGVELPKALVELAGRAMFCRTIARFLEVPAVVEAVVVTPPDHRPQFANAMADAKVTTMAVRLVEGGATRQESVALGLRAISDSVSLVCVHDAARPLVSVATIAAVLRAAAESGAATAARRPVDSVRLGVGTDATQSVDRAMVWLVETPQVFERELVTRAHAMARARGVLATDDAALVEAMTGRVATIVENESPNPKVTTAADLEWVRGLLGAAGRRAVR